MVQLNIVFGILLAYLSNYLLAGLGLGAVEWRWMFGVEAAPALAFSLLVFGIPRSPRWLVAQGREDEATRTLAMVGIGAGSAKDEVWAIKESLVTSGRGLAERLFQ